MSDKPILFNTDMVKAILDGRKTQTRRIVKDQTLEKFTNIIWNINENLCFAPYKKGDILWVRETWGVYTKDWCDADRFLYRSDYPSGATGYWFEPEQLNWCDLPKWRPSIHMPRDAARLFLKITNVRAERLQNVSETDATAEGFVAGYERHGDGKFEDVIEHEWTARQLFAETWHDIYGNWDINPWVWVIEFEKV